jgi:hypothetical protein
MSEWKRRLRGAVGSAVIWGVACAGAFLAGYLVMGALGRLDGGLGLLDGIGMAIRVGVMGGIAGGAVATLIGFMYRGRRLATIDWRRFGLAAGLTTAVFVPVFMQSMNLLSGDGMVPWDRIDGDALFMGICGGIIAAGTMKLAQRADAVAARHGGLAARTDGELPQPAAGSSSRIARAADGIALH